MTVNTPKALATMILTTTDEMQATPEQMHAYELVVQKAMRYRFRIVMVLGTLLYLVFALLDQATYPEQANELLAIRLVVGAFLIGVMLLDSFVPLKSKLIWWVDTVIIVPSVGVGVMVYLTNGSASNYHHGVGLILLAMFTINSFYVKHSIGTGIICLAAYQIGAYFNGTSFSVAQFGAFGAFTCGNLVFVSVLTHLYAKQHFNEFMKSTALAEKVAELDRVNQRLVATELLKDRFFANVSHELRTPLTLVLGPLRRFLSEWNLSEAQRSDLNVVEKNAKLLLKHVNDLLDLAKLDAGHVQAEKRSLDLASLVRFVASHFEVVAGEKNIDFEVKTPPELLLLGDAEKLKRVLFNLLGNAFKFTPQGGAIACSLRQVDGHAEIIVKDTGPGIPENMHAAIFERFRQADDSDTRTHGGTGLGLAIAREFTELHDGSITIKTVKPHGTALIVSLPIQAPFALPVPVNLMETPAKNALMQFEIDHHVEQALEDPKMPRRVTEVRDIRETRILVVEDNLEMNRFIVQALSPQFRVIAAYNGAEGLVLTRLLRPDLVITDVMMPRMSGEQLLEAVRQDANIKETPVLVLTAKADEQLRERLLIEGAQDFLSKPFSEVELKARVNNLISIKKTRDLLEKELTTKEEDLIVMTQRLADANLSHELRMHSGLQLEMHELDLVQVIEDAIDTVTPSAQTKFIAITTQFSAPSILLDGDADGLRQVALNFLSNAIRFSQEHRHIEVSIFQPDLSSVTVRVRDFGEGIAKETLPHIFDRVTHGDGSESKRHTEHGLGLATAAQIIKLHGGQIAATSPGKGRGATFEFALPIRRVTHQPNIRSIAPRSTLSLT